MRQSRRIMINSAASFAQRAVELVIQVFLLRFVLRRVSEEAYGVYGLTLSFQAAFYLLRAAISKGCISQVARLREEQNYEGINSYVGTAVAMLAVPAGLVLVLAVAGAPYIGGFLDLSPKLHRAMGWMVILTGAKIAVCLPLVPYEATVAAYQRYGVIAVMQTIANVTRALLVVALFVCVKADVMFVVVGNTLGQVAAYAGFWLFAHRLCPRMKLRLRLMDFGIAKFYVAFGTFLLLTALSRIVSLEGTKWITGKLLPVRYVTYFMVSSYVLLLIKQVIDRMTFVLVPAASRLETLGQHGALGEMLVRGTRYSAVVGMGTMACMLPVIGPLLGLWLEPGLAWLGPFSVVIGIIGALTLPAECGQQIVQGLGDSRRPFYIVSAQAIVALVVTGVCVGPLDLGLGGAIGGFGAGLVVFAAGMTFISLRRIKVSKLRFVMEAYAQPMLAGVAGGGVGCLLALRYHPQSWGILLGIAAASAVTYAVVMLVLLTPQERQLLREVWSRVARARRGQ